MTQNPVVLGVLVAAASCASVEHEAPSVVAPMPADASTPPVAERTFRIEPRDGGWKIDEFFDWLHRETGSSVLYGSTNSTWKGRLHLGPQVVAESDLEQWLRALMCGQRMNVVRVTPGPRPQWYVSNGSSSDGESVAVYVDESQLPLYASREKLYVVTAFDSADRDTTRTRIALVE